MGFFLKGGAWGRSLPIQRGLIIKTEIFSEFFAKRVGFVFPIPKLPLSEKMGHPNSFFMPPLPYSDDVLLYIYIRPLFQIFTDAIDEYKSHSETLKQFECN